VPVFDTVKTAVESTGANCALIFVPARAAPDAMYEAADAGVPLIVTISENVAVQDMMKVRSYLDQRGVRLVGPNCPGLLTPGEAKVGIIPGHIARPGNVGIVSRSGTLTYEVINALTQHGMGQSTCVGIGGDPIKGLDFVDVLTLFNDDPHTDTVVLIGEIGGSAEERAAEYIADHMTKPVVGKRMGHAGAIIEGGSGLAADKIRALQAANVKVAGHPEEIPGLLA
jgi:succinyl-CoA synthetase alpha subunit